MFYIPQVTILVFALLSAVEQLHFTFPFRTLNEEQFPLDVRAKHSKGFHTFGFWAVFCMCVGFALCITSYEVLLHGLTLTQAVKLAFVLVLLYGFVYWLVFDPAYAKLIGQAWYYLGTTAKYDIELNQLHIKRVGIAKAFVCVCSIVLLNLLTRFILS